jgi:hypothetical protein
LGQGCPQRRRLGSSVKASGLGGRVSGAKLASVLALKQAVRLPNQVGFIMAKYQRTC